jgi:hypothetical protein
MPNYIHEITVIDFEQPIMTDGMGTNRVRTNNVGAGLANSPFNSTDDLSPKPAPYQPNIYTG